MKTIKHNLPFKGLSLFLVSLIATHMAWAASELPKYPRCISPWKPILSDNVDDIINRIKNKTVFSARSPNDRENSLKTKIKFLYKKNLSPEIGKSQLHINNHPILKEKGIYSNSKIVINRDETQSELGGLLKSITIPTRDLEYYLT